MTKLAERATGLVRPYRTFLTWPGVLPVALPAYLGRLTPGMLVLALVLHLERHTGSLAVAGAATAAYYLAVGVTGPVVGRLMDRIGPTRVLVASGIVYPAALAGVIVGPRSGLHQAGIQALCVLAGLSVPQLNTVVQSLWARHLPEGEARRAAYSTDAVFTEVVFIVGPLLVSLFVVLGDPAYALVAAACCSAAGAFLVAASPLIRTVRAAASARASWIGPLKAAGMRVLVGTLTAVAVIHGVVPLVVAAFAQERAQAAASGVLLAMWSVGGIIGAVWYGGRRWSAPARRQFPWALAGLAAGLLPVAFARGLPGMTVAMLLVGLAIAPVSVLVMQLIAVVAPPDTTTEAFGWQNTANYIGFALGSSLGGVTIESFGRQLTTLAVVGVLLLALAFAWASRRALVAPAADDT